MEQFNAFEINGENVIGGTAITTPYIHVPSLTLNTAPVLNTVKSTLGGTVAKVGGILGTVKHKLDSTSINAGVSVGTGC